VLVAGLYLLPDKTSITDITGKEILRDKAKIENYGLIMSLHGSEPALISSFGSPRARWEPRQFAAVLALRNHYFDSLGLPRLHVSVPA